ncbi:Os05g0127233, partial [Oryza sativa Japonica Group]
TYPFLRIQCSVGVAAQPAVEALDGEPAAGGSGAALPEQPLLRREGHHLPRRRLQLVVAAAGGLPLHLPEEPPQRLLPHHAAAAVGVRLEHVAELLRRLVRRRPEPPQEAAHPVRRHRRLITAGDFARLLTF